MDEPELKEKRAHYSKPSLTRYRMKENIAEYLLNHSTPNVLKCSNNPPGCRGRGRSLFEPPPWG